MENDTGAITEQISTHSEVRKLFAKKLIKIMIDNGYYPAKPSGKADAIKLASIAGVSKQMAYKYLNGEAMPNPVVLEKIAEWLNCPSKWLVNNEDDHLNIKIKSIDEDLCKSIFNSMENQFIENSLSPDRFRFLIETFMQIYNYASNTGADLESKIKSAMQMIALLKKQPFNI
jgi:transcriptional regulator with XRE-family HTH domain